MFNEQILENPSLIMSETVERVNRQIVRLCKKQGIRVQDFTEFISRNDNELSNGIARLFDEINSDIMKRYSDGHASLRSVHRWKQNVYLWEEMVNRAVHSFKEIKNVTLVA